MPVKENQPGLRHDIERLLQQARVRETKAGLCAQESLAAQPVHSVGDHAERPLLRTAHTSELGHGRLEWRALRCVTVPAHAKWLCWPGRRQVFVVQRETICKKSGRRRSEKVYGITSLSEEEASAAQLLELVRSHWQIENRLHWVRDVTFDEDRSRVRTGALPQVMAAMRNTAIGLLRQDGATNIASACRACAAQPWKALALMGIQRTE